MPTLEISKKDLEGLVGKKFTNDQLADALLYIKGEIDKTDGDKIVVDVKETNRPDLWSTEGIARELRARLGKEKGIPKIKIEKPALEIIVDQNTQKVRPAVAGALVKNAKITPEFLEQLIQLQEKVAQTFGRKRKEAGIGLYEIDKLTPPIHYKAFLPQEIKFVPLEFSNEMDLEEILEKHPKGKEYAYTIKNSDKYPVWLDSKGVIASLSPIINSETTGKISTSTKNVFIEATGFNQETVTTAVMVMAMAFLERGAKVYAAKVKYKNQTIITPSFQTKKMEVSLDCVQKIFGEKISPKQALDLLAKARYNAKIKGNKISARHPSYRHDILHPIDVIEDMLISWGYNYIKPQKIEMNVRGNLLSKTRFLEDAKEVCIGLGLQEVLTFTMTSKEKQQSKIGLQNEEFIEIENPLSQSYEIFRKNIFPELLEFLAKNKKSVFPQKIFEIGKTLQLNQAIDTGAQEKNHLAIVISGKGSDFTQAKSLLEGFLKAIEEKAVYKESTMAFLEKGRQALVQINGKHGFLGELAQNTMKEFRLEEQTAIIEIELE